jgi:hypothetical protein
MYKLNISIIGDVANVKGNDNSAYLQFINSDDDGISLINVKVKGAKKDDLLQFKGKNVVLNDVKIFQSEFQKFYSVDDITKIKFFNKNS